MAISTGVCLYPPTFDNHHDGFGICNTKPQISWRFRCTDSSIKGWSQNAYEIEINRNERVESYRVESADSLRVPWPSSPLGSKEAAQVRVRSFGYSLNKPEPRPTDWSAWASLETGLLERAEWHAQLITGQLITSPDKPIRPLLLRRSFQTPAGLKVRRARLYITAQGVYHAYMNGCRVGDHFMAPGFTAYRFRFSYQQFDVTKLVHNSHTNFLAAEVGEGWYASSLWREGRQIYGKNIGLVAQLEIDFEGENAPFVVTTDAEWEWSMGPIQASELYNGELYDMREEQPGWRVGSGGPLSTAWSKVTVLPLPSETLSSPEGPPVRVTEEIPPQRIFRSPSGKLLIDFGQNLVGILRIQSLSKPDGHCVIFQHAEVLERGEICMRPLRAAKCTDKIVCSGRELEAWSPSFTFHGFRYVQVEGWSPDDAMCPLQEDSIRALVLHSDMKRTGWFSCSDSRINRLHENSVWSMRGNFLSIPTDCPQRDERLGWTGDISIFSPTANFLYDTDGMLSDWLVDLSLEQNDGNGVPPMIVPNVQFAKQPRPPQAVWGDGAVLVPWSLYRSFGDKAILQRQYHSMKSWLDQGCARGEDGLWTDTLWHHGDWLDPSAPPEDPGNGQTDGVYVADAYLVYVTGILSQIAMILEKPHEAKRYSEDHIRLRCVFQEKYITPKGMVMCDTQTSLSLALMFSLFETQDQVKTAGQRLARKVRFARFRVATGFAGTPIVTHALSKTGRNDLAYRMLLETNCPSWLYPVTMGATTTWERWNSMLPDGTINPGQMTSFNHYALGSVVNWLHENVGGISIIEPGWRVFKVQPVPGGTIKSACIQYESPYGFIECSWSVQDASRFIMKLSIPPNTSALVFLPEEGCVSSNEKKGNLLPSGYYEMSCQFKADPWPPSPLETLFKPPARRVTD
ncbi:bacterial alpha-L-rhamnosidase-domain-containing protein [Aspergillus ambiguus]|uniref:bacterial alpha-L-rhamnosidase-domain-containing protein n=1 Tax=Aspergillus ambiguus TaxID=176160 RepID=UPI003CCE3D56